MHYHSPCTSSPPKAWYGKKAAVQVNTIVIAFVPYASMRQPGAWQLPRKLQRFSHDHVLHRQLTCCQRSCEAHSRRAACMSEPDMAPWLSHVGNVPNCTNQDMLAEACELHHACNNTRLLASVVRACMQRVDVHVQAQHQCSTAT